MQLYKLTDSQNQTFNATQWGEGVVHETSGNGDLCSEGWLHAYEHPLLAVLLNRIHANFKTPNLWEAIGEGKVKRDGQRKLGVTRLTTTKQISLPIINIKQYATFAILCAKTCCADVVWNKWADSWLSDEIFVHPAECPTILAAKNAVSSAFYAAENNITSLQFSTAMAVEYTAYDNPNLDLIAIAEEACK